MCEGCSHCLRSKKTAPTLHTLNDCRIVNIADKNAVYAVFTICLRFAFKKVAGVEEEEEEIEVVVKKLLSPPVSTKR